MEGECLSCIKYLMFIFNFFIFLGGAVLLGLGVWLLLEPVEVLEVGGANPLLLPAALYSLLGLGTLLFLLGFLGCCGAIRQNKCLLLFFFMLILIIFLAELGAAILAFIFREHLSRSYFTRELKHHYQGSNSTDVFTHTWNAVMTTFECCGVNGAEDFEGGLFRRLSPSRGVPEACCHSNRLHGHAPDPLLSPQDCTLIHHKGCYSALVDYFETYIYLAGALAIVVLTTELLAMIFAMCLFQGIQ